MICYLRKYHYKITWGVSGEQFDVTLTKEIELTRKQANNEMFFRTESSEWILLKWQNPGVYAKILSMLNDVEGTTEDLFALVHYFADGITYTHPEYAGYVSLDGIKLDEYLGKITFKPKPYDNYTWFDLNKDVKLDYRRFATSTDFKVLRYQVPSGYANHAYFQYCLPLLTFIQGIPWLLGITDWTVQSDFFTNATNPVTGAASKTINLYTTPAYLGKSIARDWGDAIPYPLYEEVYYLGKFYISINDTGGYNLHHHPDLSPTWWGEINRFSATDTPAMGFTLGELFEMLKKVFNCYWYISGGNLIIENLKYFENAYSYTVPAGVIVDLTNQTTYPIKYQILRDILNNEDDQNSNRIPIEFKIEEIPAIENFKYSLSFYDPVKITYSSHLVSKNKIDDTSITNWLGEIDYFHNDDFDKVDDQTMMLLSANPTPVDFALDIYWDNIVVFQYFVYGMYYPLYVQNAYCYLQYTYPLFHTYGRYLLNGTIDGSAMIFDSKKHYLTQQVRYPRFEIESTFTLSPEKIKTDRGNMTVEEIKIICDSGWVEVKLNREV